MNEFQTINVNLLNLSEEEREQLMSLIKKANQPQKNRWRGEKNDVYYSITGDGRIVDNRESESTCDDVVYQFGNYFKTKEEAEFELNKRLVSAFASRPIRDLMMSSPSRLSILGLSNRTRLPFSS